MEIRDLETLGPLVASSLRSDVTAQGPRVSKSRISMDSPYNLYLEHSNAEYLYFFLIDKFVPSVHSLQEIATRANTNPEAK